jgi:hypothetical protein
MDWHNLDWYTVMLPTIFISVYYSTVILGNMWVFIRDGEKKFADKLKLKKKRISKKKSVSLATSTVSSIMPEQASMKKLAKRGKFLRLAIFMSEFMFIILIVLIIGRYSNYELKMESSFRLKIATFVIFSVNIFLHVYCFVFTVVKPLIDFKRIYEGNVKKSNKELEFQTELELEKYRMERKFKKLVYFRNIAVTRLEVLKNRF